MKHYIIGLDIGGTTVKIGLIQLNGDIKEKWEIPTNTENQGLSIVTDVWESIEERLTKLNVQIDDILGIGVGAPGFINGDTGLVYEAVNIGWKNFELGKEFEKVSNLPVIVENDANIAVLGENWIGAGNRSQNVIAVTLGTGVGGGIITNGQVLNGENGTAGEIGHITVAHEGYRCNCGRVGCLETVASATGIVRKAMDKIQDNPESLLAKHVNSGKDLTSKEIFDLAAAGDSISLEIIDEISDLLGFVISNLAIVINPSKVLIGGGVSKAGDFLIDKIDKAFKKYALPRISNVCEIKLAKLGNDAGIIGAAFLVQQRLSDLKF
ncbi:ROK family glucokinase [Ornithinibacillus halophilus]|uniref:Glucokinase n=1 Tax=Ornithinibacillus halophilus TaxID=930117 RepID=A0A1M5D1V6_9BACI|nr:ROK family glucokinase [Ornithinibacillus halophilus]SHF60971.1 glucokinase [Ornithinibacillus halophilus]